MCAARHIDYKTDGRKDEETHENQVDEDEENEKRKCVEDRDVAETPALKEVKIGDKPAATLPPHTFLLSMAGTMLQASGGIREKR